MDEYYETLEAVADGIREELKRRYPLLAVVKYKLAAPGYSLSVTDMEAKEPKEFAVKITNIGVLVDVDSTSEIEPSRIHRRLATIDYSDPRLIDKMFAITDTFVVEGRLESW